jgi:hypothetical protein
VAGDAHEASTLKQLPACPVSMLEAVCSSRRSRWRKNRRTPVLAAGALPAWGVPLNPAREAVFMSARNLIVAIEAQFLHRADCRPTIERPRKCDQE